MTKDKMTTMTTMTTTMMTMKVMTTTTAIQTMSKEYQIRNRDITIRKLLTIYLSIIAKERDINMKRTMVHALFNYMLTDAVKSCIRNDVRNLRMVIMGKIDELEHCALCLEHAELMATLQCLKSFLNDCNKADYKLVFGRGSGRGRGRGSGRGKRAHACACACACSANDCAAVFLCSRSSSDNHKDLLKKIKKYLTSIERLNDSIIVSDDDDDDDDDDVESEEQPPPPLRRSKRLRSIMV